MGIPGVVGNCFVIIFVHLSFGIMNVQTAPIICIPLGTRVCMPITHLLLRYFCLVYSTLFGLQVVCSFRIYTFIGYAYNWSYLYSASEGWNRMLNTRVTYIWLILGSEAASQRPSGKSVHYMRISAANTEVRLIPRSNRVMTSMV